VPSPFRLSCLGEPQLFDSSGEPVRFRTRKHFALLIRLALEPGHVFSRDTLTELLWPDAPARQARHSLAQGISVLRAKLGRENVLVRTASVGLRAGAIETDVAQLGGGTDGAIRGPFLDGFAVPRSRPFDDWKDQWTAHLIPKVRDALTRHMDAARRIADFATVERHAQLLHDLDTTSEEAVRGLMESRAWVGDRTNALKIFQRYEALLADELGAKPSPDLVRVANLLRDGRGAVSRAPEAGERPSPAHRRFEPEMLIGREREFGALYDAWLDVRRRNPRIMVVLGDPGIGKTTLCNSFAASCQMEGAVVARVQAYDAERELPFAVVSELIRQLVTQRALAGADPEALSELSRIAPEISEVYPGVPKAVQWTPEVMSLRLADAFRKALVAASEDNPLIVLVDDLHAADASSTAILHVACRKLTGARLLIVFTARRAELQTTEGPAALVCDTYLKWLQTVELEPLPAAAAEQLVRSYIGGAAERREAAPVARILHAANGNPLALELVTREWLERGAESLLRDLEALNTQPLPSLGIPRAIRTMFERLIQRLDPATRAALDLAAVLGRRLSDVSLYEAVDLHSGRAAEALSRLLEIGLLREVGGELEFKNELIRAQAYYAVAGQARQHLHRRVAATLAERPVEEGHAARLEIAWHYMRGGEAEKALPHALEGSEAALGVGAPAEAEEILGALIRERPQSAPLIKVRALFARALLDQSKATTLLPVLEEILVDTSTPLRDKVEATLMKAAATYLVNCDSGDLLCEVTSEALARAESTSDVELISRAQFEYARSGLSAGAPERLEKARRDLERILEDPRHEATATTHFAGAFCDFFSNDVGRAARRMKTCVEMRDRSGNLVERARAYNGYGVCLRGLLRIDDACRSISKALELTQRYGDDGRASTFASNLCHTETLRGNFERAIEVGLLSVELGTRAVSQPELNNAYMNLADVHMLVGDRTRAYAYMEQARTWMAAHQRTWQANVSFLLESASFALMLGNVALALGLVEEIEGACGHKERPILDSSLYEKLKVFRAGHTKGRAAAFSLASEAIEKYRDRHPYYFVNAIAAMAWVERTFDGAQTVETDHQLTILDCVPGKKALLRAQGFLQ
jgi:DNA-binding SARP family transcriptional activator/tetratricopeptide (TPR) repeat protein